MSVLSMNKVSYQYKEARQSVLSQIDQEFEAGKFYAIIGKSGSGKSTLLSLLAALDNPTSGKILFEGEDIQEKGDSYHRKHHISLVFQNYNLIDYLTPLENIRLVNPQATKEILLQLGLEESHVNRNVLKLSGGQQQRVAIARSLVSEDEPTGNLDEQTAGEIIDVLKALAKERQKCVIVVTHSKEVANAADTILELRETKLHEVK